MRLTPSLCLAIALAMPLALRAQCSTPQGNALLSIGGLPYPGSSLVFSVAATPGLPLALAFDTGAGPMSFPGGGTICLGPTASFLTSLFGPFMLVPQTGVWSMNVAIPNDLALVGSTFHFQAGVVDATAPNGKIAFSNGVALTIAPLPSYSVVFYDGFETNPPQGPWTATNGLWGAFVPTGGPGAFDGVKCATPSPAGSYPACGVDTTFQSQIFALPTVAPGNRILLRYQVWFLLQDGVDSVHAMIMPNAQAPGASFQFLPGASMTGDCGGVWTQAGADLTAFAGQFVRLGYRLIANDCCCSGTGAFVDEVKVVVTGPPQIGLNENWDSPAGMGIEWTVSNGLWEVGTPPTSVPAGNTLPPQPWSGSRVAGTLLGLDYPACGADTQLVSPPFVVPALAPGQLVNNLYFHYWLSCQTGVDGGSVQYSTDGGTSWNPLEGGYDQSTGWVFTSVPLWDAGHVPLAGQTIKLAFFFISNDCCCGGAGWFLDDIFVQ